MLDRAFTILAALLVIVAAVCLWFDRVSAAFVTGTLGAVSWFIGYRFRLRAGIPVTDDDEKELIEDVDDESHDQGEDHDPVAR
jgi:hypothetical protein